MRVHLECKLGATLFIAAQFSMLTYIAIKLMFGSPLEYGLLLFLFSFNLGAWVCSYLAIRMLFAPVERTVEELRAHLERRATIDLPNHHKDTIGQLMRDASYLARRARQDADYLSQSGETDPLNGFYTRHSGKRRLAEEVARAERHGFSFHFAFISLDNLHAPAAV